MNTESNDETAANQLGELAHPEAPFLTGNHTKIWLHHEPGADPKAVVTSITKNDGPQNCSQCHQDVPAAMESVRESLNGVEAGLPTKLFPKDVRAVLEALERHHAR